MFTAYKNSVVEILKKTVSGDLVPAEQIVAGPVSEPTELPTVAFTAGDFEVLQDGQIMDIPKDTEELRFRLSSRLEVWADELKKVEEIILQAMAAILIHTKTIEEESKSFIEMGNLKLSFVNSHLIPLKGVTLMNNGSPAKGEVTYAMESLMTVTQLDFDFGKKMELIDTFLRRPSEISFQTKSPQAILEQPVIAIKGLGQTISDALLEKNIMTIKELALAEKNQLIGVSTIGNLIQKARGIRRVTNEILQEIIAREHPFPEGFFSIPLHAILEMSIDTLEEQTGKNEENIRIFLDDLAELKENMKSAKFGVLTLTDFI